MAITLQEIINQNAKDSGILIANEGNVVTAVGEPAIKGLLTGAASPPTVFNTGNTPNSNRAIPAGYGGGQSFLTTGTGQIQQLNIKMYQSGGATGTVTCEIWSDDGGGLPNTLLGTSDPVAASSISTNSGFPADDQLFTFTGGPSLSNATTYHAIVRVDSATGTFTLKVTSSSSYANGQQVESSDGISWSAPGGGTLDCYLEVTLQDIAASGPTFSSVNQDNNHLALWESTETNRINIKTPASISDHDMVLPASQGAANSIMTNDGSGNLDWSNQIQVNSITTVGSPTLDVDTNIADGSLSQTSVSAGTIYGQQITMTSSGDITEIIMVTATQGGATGGGLTLEIWSVDGSGHPDTLLGSSDTIAHGSILGGPTSFPFSSPVAILAGIQYAVVVNSTITGINYTLRYTSADQYAGGGRLISTDSGSNWFVHTFADIDLKVYVTSSSEIEGLRINGETSGYIGISVPSTVTNYSIKLPSAQGSADTYLKNDGSGNLSWGAVPATDISGKADTDLSNLGTTSINASLTPDALHNLGSISNFWGLTYVTALEVGNSGERLTITRTGESMPGGESGNTIRVRPNAGTDLGLHTLAGTDTDDIRLETGNGTTTSGDIFLRTGTATTTRGKLVFEDGSEGTAGHVWTSSDTNGSGGWAALPTSTPTMQASYDGSPTWSGGNTMSFTKSGSGIGFNLTNSGNGTGIQIDQTGPGVGLKINDGGSNDAVDIRKTGGNGDALQIINSSGSSLYGIRLFQQGGQDALHVDVQANTGYPAANIKSLSSVATLRLENNHTTSARIEFKGSSAGADLTTEDNAVADPSATKSLILATGNKTAGTGNSGDITFTTGTAIGGTRGDITLNANGVSVNSDTGVSISGADPANYSLDISHNVADQHGIRVLANSITNASKSAIYAQMSNASGHSALQASSSGSYGVHISGNPSNGLWIDSASFRGAYIRNNNASQPTIEARNQNTSGPVFKLAGATSGALEVKVPAAITNHALTLPGTQGGVGTILENDGSGGLTWGTGFITGNLGSLSTNYTIPEGSNRVLRLTATAAIDITLPTTSVKNGQTVELINLGTGANEITVKASGGAIIDTISKGRIKLIATQDAPTTAAHWIVTEVYEEYEYTTGWTFTGGATTGSEIVRLVRNRDLVSLWIGQTIQTTSATATGNLSADTGISKARFYPQNNTNGYTLARDNGTLIAGEISVSSTGNISFYAQAQSSFAGGTGGNTGAENATQLTWNLN